MTESHSFVEVFFSFESALNFTLDWIEDNFDPNQEFIEEQGIKLMDSGAYRAGVILRKKQLDFDMIYGAEQDA